MQSSKAFFLVLSIWVISLPLHAQIDFAKYFDDNTLPLLDVQDHLDPTFKWNMPGNIQVYLNEGINYMKDGNPELGISNLDEVLKLDTASWIAYYYRGICHKHLSKFESAERDLIKSKELAPKQAVIYLELGEIYHMRNAFNKATTAYEKAIEVDPNLTQAYYNLGSLSLVKGDVKKGLRYYEKCNQVNPKFPQAYMIQALLKFKAKKKDNESIALFNKAIAADSSYAPTYFWRGLAHIGLDQPHEALNSWNTLMVLKPENYFYTLMRGCLFIELGDYDNAFNDLRKAMRAHAVDDERFVGGQTILDKQIDLQYAANYLISTGYGLDEKAFGYLKKGFCLMMARKYKEALEEIDRAQNVQSSATVFFVRALAYDHSGDHNSALKYYNRALALDNDIFDAHKKRSIYRAELKDWKGADSDFNEMFRLQPSSPVVHRLRGLVRSQQEDFKGAIDDLTKFIRTDSSDYESIRTRSVCFVMLGDEKAGNEDMRKLLRLDGGWELYETVATNYLKLRDTVNAIEVWQEFATARPQLFIPYMELARIYVAQEKWDSVKVQIERLMPIINPDFMTKQYAEILYWEGLLAYQNASFEAAIAKFSKSLKTDASNPAPKYFRAKAYQNIGEPKKAKADLKALTILRYKDASALYSALQE